jgi:hypothetical protein
MKAVSFLLLALGAASVSACSSYNFCHCDNSDSTPDNSATDAICSYFGNTATSDGNDPNNVYDVCPAGQNAYNSQFGWNNCLWRVYCKIKGATGGDSLCQDHY